MADNYIKYMKEGLKHYFMQEPYYDKMIENANASTGKYDKKIETHFNWGKLKSATDLSVARTMIHEAIHAFLLNEMDYDRINLNSNYPEMIETFNKFKDKNKAHHAEMGAKFIDEIAKGLKAYGESKGYNLSDQYYEDLSWGGLRYYDGDKNKLTDIFVATVPNKSDRDRIGKTIVNEFKRNNKSKGKKPCE